MDIDSRLSEIDSLADGPRKELETSILRWHIDTLLRIELSKKNGDTEKIWDVCRRHGFIPQPEISRSEPIDPRKIEISEFGKVVLTENFDNTLSIIRTSDMHVWTSVRCPGKHFLSRRGRYLLFDTEYGRTVLLNVDELTTTELDLPGQTEKVCWSADDSMLAVGTKNGVLVFGLPDCVEITTFEGTCSPIAFSKDGLSLLIASPGTVVSSIDGSESHRVDCRLSDDSLAISDGDGFTVLSGPNLYRIGLDGTSERINRHPLDVARKLPAEPCNVCVNGRPIGDHNWETTVEYRIEGDRLVREGYFSGCIKHAEERQNIRPGIFAKRYGYRSSFTDGNYWDELLGNDIAYTSDGTYVTRHRVIHSGDRYLKIVSERRMISRPSFELASPMVLIPSEAESVFDNSLPDVDWSEYSLEQIGDKMIAYAAHIDMDDVDISLNPPLDYLRSRARWITDGTDACAVFGYGGTIRIVGRNSRTLNGWYAPLYAERYAVLHHEGSWILVDACGNIAEFDRLPNVKDFFRGTVLYKNGTLQHGNASMSLPHSQVRFFGDLAVAHDWESEKVILIRCTDMTTLDEDIVSIDGRWLPYARGVRAAGPRVDGLAPSYRYVGARREARSEPVCRHRQRDRRVHHGCYVRQPGRLRQLQGRLRG